jgi:hypothetical protein
MKGVKTAARVFKRGYNLMVGTLLLCATLLFVGGSWYYWGAHNLDSAVNLWAMCGALMVPSVAVAFLTGWDEERYYRETNQSSQ